MKNLKKIIELLGVFLLIGCSVNDVNLELKTTDSIQIEYGELVNTDLKKYLLEPTEEVLINAKISIRDDVKEFELDKVLPVGDYVMIITYEDEIKDIELIVKDATAPTFKKETDIIEVEQGTQNINYNEYFECDDLSGCSISANDEGLILDKEGESKLVVIAKDIYDNTIEKEVIVKVTKKEDTSPKNDINKNKKPSKEDSNKSSSSTANKQDKENSSNKEQSSNNIVDNKEEPELVSKYFTDIEQEVYRLINAERSKIGLNTLPWDSSIKNICDKRAKELYTEHLNGNVHSGLEKYDPYDRLGEIALVGFWFDNPAEAVQSWMDSPGHKSWIVNPDNTDMVVSVYFDKDSESFNYIVLFANDMTHTHCVNDVCTDFKVKTAIDGTQTYCYDGVCRASIEEFYEEP